MSRKIFTVSQVNKYVKHLFSHDYLLNNIWVNGEISNLKMHNSGHIYFTLKDKTGAISSVMFKGNADGLKFGLEEGMAVLVKGYVSIYEKTGQYQLYIEKIEIEGEGALYKAYEQLKKKLEAEGLFRTEIKKTIPFYPDRIGIITSETGAAIRDIINISQRRNKSIQLILIPTLVQGEEAAGNISKAIKKFNELKNVDVIIVGRGGGSIEDLWAFNEEIVARAIYDSDIPIISAVGHETDFTISDFVADLRAPTPSAAAELAVPSKAELKDDVEKYYKKLDTLVWNNIMNLRHKQELILNHPIFKYPTQIIDQNKQYLDQLERQFKLVIEKFYKDNKIRVENDISKLEILSPKNIINRGYALIYDENNNNIASVDELKDKKKILIELKDGSVEIEVNKIRVIKEV